MKEPIEHEELRYILEFYGDGEYYRRAKVIRNSEKRLKRKPTQKDIAETALFLHDFGYDNVEIPDLPSYNALVRWRRDYVVEQMNKEERR